MKLGTYLAAGISDKIQNAVGHAQIRRTIAQIKEGKDNVIMYDDKLEIGDIENLCKMLNGNTIKAKHDLFLQFLYEQGFFYPISFSTGRLQLVIPNQSVFNKIDEIVAKVNLIENFENEHKDLVGNFNEAVENLTKSCIKEDFFNVAESIKNMMINMKPSPVSEMDVQCELRSALRKKFSMVAAGRESCQGTFCDIILVHGPSGVGFILKIKFGTEDRDDSCDAAHAQIFTRRYDTMLDDVWVKKLYPNFTGTIKKKIYLGIHMDKEFKVSIKYSINGEKEPDTVYTEPHKIIS
ncbi:hypothetical protein PV327_002700 [Microctonus hyperodae]|uniref:Uncharacterized protein n=1 Tax=Microctonus hyperodae TaxID=165561 RepID=A0AA39FG41_MICHY|nr:hypothetical protein PV327_002700 [Microctonus hyperodae]